MSKLFFKFPLSGRWSNRNGSLILEALVAIGVAALCFTALVSVWMMQSFSDAKNSDRLEALFRAKEGVAALESMDFANLTPTESGALRFQGNQLSVVGGNEYLGGGVIRTISVVAVNRDADCLYSVSGGTADPDSLTLSSTVTWTDVLGQARALTSTKMRTRFEGPEGTCFKLEEAAQVAFGLSEANWHGQKQLREVYIENTGSDAVTIDKVTITWSNGRTIDQVFLSETKVWSASGPGTPSGNQPSGTELDTQDEVIRALQTVEMHKTQFSGNMIGTTVTIDLEFSDGSTLSSGPFVPDTD